MNFRKISLLVLILLIADQALKIWVKTHMHLDESIVVYLFRHLGFWKLWCAKVILFSHSPTIFTKKIYLLRNLY